MIHQNKPSDFVLQNMPPRIWKRYVNDTFIVTTRSTVNNLHMYMNSQQQTIHFTMDVLSNNQIAWHTGISTITLTTIYRKGSHADQHLAFHSRHPHYVKSGVVRCLYDRASNIVPKPRYTATQRQHIQSAIMRNGDLKYFIQRIVKTRRKSTKTFTQDRGTACLSFIDVVSQRLRRRLECRGICTVFSCNITITLRNYLVHPNHNPPFQLDVTELCMGFLAEVAIRCT